MLLKKSIARKRKRRPSQWGPEEKSNPDYEWLQFLKDMKDVLGRGPERHEATDVGMYLRVSRKYKNRPEPLRSHERRKMREMIRVLMQDQGLAPSRSSLRLMYKQVKGKTKKELWK